MRKWKLTALLISQAALTYAIFIVCVHSPKSKYRQINEAIGTEQNALRSKETKLNSIIFGRVRHPTGVTVQQVKKDSSPNTRIDRAEILSPEDKAFLEDAAKGK